MKLIPLPEGADDTTRVAYASFAMNILVLPVLRNSHMSEEGWKAMLQPIIEMYGQGDTPGARWVRESLGAEAQSNAEAG